MKNDDDAQRGDAREWDHRTLRGITFHAVLAGLCPLIPIPLLDDRILLLVRRRMARELAREQGVELAGPELSRLVDPPPWRARGCALGCLVGAAFQVAIRIVQKLFRTILVVLAVKDAVDTASRVFHEGYLIAHAVGRGGLDPSVVRTALDATLDAVDPRPIEKAVRTAFGGSRRLVARAARLLARARPRSTTGLPIDEEEALLAGLVDPLTAALAQERPYLLGVADRFERNLSASQSGSGSRPAGGARPVAPDQE